MSAISARVLRRFSGPTGLLTPGTHVPDVSPWRNWKALVRTGYLRITGGDTPAVDELARDGFVDPIHRDMQPDMAEVMAGIDDDGDEAEPEAAEAVEQAPKAPPVERPRHTPTFGGKRPR